MNDDQENPRRTKEQIYEDYIAKSERDIEALPDEEAKVEARKFLAKYKNSSENVVVANNTKKEDAENLNKYIKTASAEYKKTTNERAEKIGSQLKEVIVTITQEDNSGYDVVKYLWKRISDDDKRKIREECKNHPSNYRELGVAITRYEKSQENNSNDVSNENSDDEQDELIL